MRSIRLENFVPYYGRVDVDFPANGDRNVYVIVGDNGYGKSSFLKAVSWAFFGGRSLGEDDRLVNSTAKAEGANKTSVSVVFEEAGDTYTLTREYEIGKGESVALGTRRAQDEAEEAEDKIREIFPQHTARFFIFEGEMVRELAQAQGQEQARSSIEILLGLQALRSAVADLAKLEDEVMREMQSAQSRHQEFQKTKQAHSDLAAKLKVLETTLQNEREKHAVLTNNVNVLEARLSQLDEIRPMVERKESLEKEVRALKERRTELVDNRKRLVQDCHLLLLLAGLQDAENTLSAELDKVLAEEYQSQEARVRVRLLDISARDDRCALCGNSPLNLDELQRRRDGLLERAPVTAGARNSTEMREHLDLIRRSQSEAVSLIGGPLSDILSGIEAVEASVRAKEGEVRHLSGQVAQFDHSESRQIRESYAETLRQLGAIEAGIEELLDDRSDLSQELSKLQSELSRYGGIEEKQRRLVEQLSLVRECQKAFEEILAKSLTMNRARILDASNRFFARLTNKPREHGEFDFAFADTYAFQIVRKDGHHPDMDMISDGEKEVVAMSFVLGLSEYSQIKAPLIMDGVNSRLDGVHRSNLASLWAGLDNQVILLGIDKDFDTDTRRVFADAIAAEYEIVRENDQYSVIEPRSQ